MKIWYYQWRKRNNRGKTHEYRPIKELYPGCRKPELCESCWILKITQSAVSRQIHSLEDELGTRLLHRTTRTVTLTPAGISFLEDAKNIMGRLRIAKQKLKRHQSTNIQVLTIGCHNEASLDLLCKILNSCRKQMPELYPFLKVIPHRSILNLFYQDELDLLFGFQDDIPISFLPHTLMLPGLNLQKRNYIWRISLSAIPMRSLPVLRKCKTRFHSISCRNPPICARTCRYFLPL